MSKLSTPGPLDFSNAQEQWNDWIKCYQRYRKASGLDEKAVKRQADTLIYIMGEEAEKVYAQLEIKEPNRSRKSPRMLTSCMIETVTAFYELFQSN